VDWARFEPNFFAVFEPGVLEDAPQMGVIMTRSPDPDSRARVQRDIVERFPNVAVVDLTVLQQTLDDVIGKVTLAIRFMALFSVASGILILVGALATSRRQRMREVTLLRILGAVPAGSAPCCSPVRRARPAGRRHRHHPLHGRRLGRRPVRVRAAVPPARGARRVLGQVCPAHHPDRGGDGRNWRRPPLDVLRGSRVTGRTHRRWTAR
jgi:hypothetical protein